jgi:hypothetical protein
MDTVLLRLEQREAAIEIVLDRGRVVEAAGGEPETESPISERHWAKAGHYGSQELCCRSVRLKSSQGPDGRSVRL